MKKALLFTAISAVIFGSCCNQSSDATIEKFNDIQKGVKTAFAPDGRSKTFETTLEKEGNTYVLRGVTTEKEAKDSLLKALETNNIKAQDSLFMLPCAKLGDKIYGVTTQSVVNFRTSGKYSAESATQAMMGTPVKLLQKKGGWTRAITPEGYISWVTSGSIQEMNQEEYNKYMAAPKVIVTDKYVTMTEGPSASSQMVSDAVWGNIFLDLGSNGAWQKVAIADGRTGYLPKSSVQNFDKWLDNLTEMD